MENTPPILNSGTAWKRTVLLVCFLSVALAGLVVRYDLRQELNVQKLFQASKDGNLPMVKALLGKGLSPTTRGTHNVTAISFAVSENRMEVVKYLLDHCEPGAKKALVDEAEKVAAQLCLVSMLSYLRETGSRSAADSPHLSLPLNTTTVIFSRSRPSITREERIETVKLLLSFGTPSPDNLKKALFSSVRNPDFLEAARLLIQAGAAVNASDGYNLETPLMEAVSSRSPEMIQLLLDRGADRTMRNKDGKTARDLAVARFSAPVSENEKKLIDLLKPTTESVKPQEPASSAEIVASEPVIIASLPGNIPSGTPVIRASEPISVPIGSETVMSTTATEPIQEPTVMTASASSQPPIASERLIASSPASAVASPSDTPIVAEPAPPVPEASPTVVVSPPASAALEPGRELASEPATVVPGLSPAELSSPSIPLPDKGNPAPQGFAPSFENPTVQGITK